VAQHSGERHAVELTVAEDGRPVAVCTQCWSDANPERVFRLQPFGGMIGEVGTFEGCTVAVRLEAGNLFGIDRYVPFVRPRVVAMRYR
jgi:hypothetical protein